MQALLVYILIRLDEGEAVDDRCDSLLIRTVFVSECDVYLSLCRRLMCPPPADAMQSTQLSAGDEPDADRRSRPQS